MKNIFQKFFGMSKNATANSANSEKKLMEVNDTVLTTETTIPESLFVDSTQPIIEEVSVRKSGVKEFIKQNHQEVGYLDGYNYHSADVMSQSINAMASKFRQLIEIEIQNVESEITELQVHFAAIGFQFNDLNSQLKIRIEERKKFVLQYREQMIQSVELEGWVGSPIMEYKKGFQRGLSTYLIEKGFLDSYQII